ncbi:hypothetical protein [Sulfurisphaera tokodaii]|uniref:Uncharacterized protein n=2 Tax=Sulfurisphaera tokodaii TaxID=111955 RepID=Q96Z37_SULTO|nr:hypothetical protein [Sulfurisphaera tokodaii]BAB67089.1 hypothetical protein STK_19950 [Sulfurisphaera tokodaii str. 7]HII73397.1 hypothetical protein [Sulfurisphaera tokodaii]
MACRLERCVRSILHLTTDHTFFISFDLQHKPSDYLNVNYEVKMGFYYLINRQYDNNDPIYGITALGNMSFSFGESEKEDLKYTITNWLKMVAIVSISRGLFEYWLKNVYLRDLSYLLVSINEIGHIVSDQRLKFYSLLPLGSLALLKIKSRILPKYLIYEDAILQVTKREMVKTIMSQYDVLEREVKNLLKRNPQFRRLINRFIEDNCINNSYEFT